VLVGKRDLVVERRNTLVVAVVGFDMEAHRSLS